MANILKHLLKPIQLAKKHIFSNKDEAAIATSNIPGPPNTPIDDSPLHSSSAISYTSELAPSIASVINVSVDSHNNSFVSGQSSSNTQINSASMSVKSRNNSFASAQSSANFYSQLKSANISPVESYKRVMGIFHPSVQQNHPSSAISQENKDCNPTAFYSHNNKGRMTLMGEFYKNVYHNQLLREEKRAEEIYKKAVSAKPPESVEIKIGFKGKYPTLKFS